jgi:ubiquinone/menaquinone biosynthesis C-methylase UbiE
MMLDDAFSNIAGLDPSLILLQRAKTTLGPDFHPVIGVAESLPFGSNVFSGVLTCFSFRDVRNKQLSMAEFARVARLRGRLAIVDVGKPDGLFQQKLIGLYVVVIMPIIARFFIGGRLRGNPFQMIVPTFHQLATNRTITRMAERNFGPAKLHEFLLGGLVIVEAERTE